MGRENSLPLLLMLSAARLSGGNFWLGYSFAKLGWTDEVSEGQLIAELHSWPVS